MSEQTYLLQLSGMDLSDGEITFATISEVAEALQLLATRVGRVIGRVEGPGRTPHGIELASTLRLRGLRPGSTELLFALGNADTLPEIPDEVEIRAKFEHVIAGIADNAPPSWVNPLVAAAAAQVAVSLKQSGAKTFSVGATDPNPRPVTQESVPVDGVDDTVWQVTDQPVPERVDVVVAGRLEAVDLKAGRFRIRDDVGNEIRLDDVRDIDTAAPLIGSRVVATGPAERDAKNRLRLLNPSVAPELLPAGWLAAPTDTVGDELTIPNEPVAGISDDEIEDFLAELRR